MPMLENVILLFVVIVFLWNGLIILQFVMFLYYKFRYSHFKLSDKQSVERETLDTIKPLEDFLLSQDFIYKSVLIHRNPMIGNEQDFHTFYYYNPITFVHAYIRTQPYRGALEAVKITYETIYNDYTIIETVNGEKYGTPATPEYVTLFDHEVSNVNEGYLAHLNDRKITNEEINSQALTEDILVEFRTNQEVLYIESWAQKGILKLTEYGYRFIFSFETLKFSRENILGYKRFSKILQKGSLKKDNFTNLSQSHAIMAQLEEMEKPRGQSNKMLWFSISAIAFVVLFGLLGLSFVDVFLLAFVLLIHELGHYLAMRYFGYKDTSIFFLPFGAVTIGKKEKKEAFQEFIVSLAGPLPGILIALAIIVYGFFDKGSLGQEGYIQTYVVMSLFINYLNLLPIYPLDGGRILQVLILLRYPKGQFYFYLMSLAVLIMAMIYLQDPFLLIFVVLVGLGLKQNYRIAQLLKTLLKNNKQEDIDKKIVAQTVTKDAIYENETLATKANIAKQALTIIETKKASKLLLFFGFGFYLLLLSPLFILSYLGYSAMNYSDYANLPPEAQLESKAFHKTVSSYKGLTQKPMVSSSLDHSMDILDHYLLKEGNRTIGKALDVRNYQENQSCPLPNDLKKMYEWHNGITHFFADENFFSYKKLDTNYQRIVKEQKKYDTKFKTDFRVFIGGYGDEGLAYHCQKEGIYRYSIYSYFDTIKVFYDYNHLLKVTAEAYKRGIYFYDYHEFYVNTAKLFNLNREYLSSIDRERYEKLIIYLKNKAYTYQLTPHAYLKLELLNEIAKTYDSRMINSLKMYLEDKEQRVRQTAVQALGLLGDKSVIPLLLEQLDDNPMHCYGCGLSGLSYLVDKSDAYVLDYIDSSIRQRKLGIRRNAYSLIAEIANKKSLPLLMELFKEEEDFSKLIMVRAFGRIGSQEALPLLKEYLEEVNHKFTQHQKNVMPPETLKYEVEKAIKNIEMQ